MLIDSHAHLSSDKVWDLAPEMIEAALKKQVSRIVNICTDIESLERGLILKKQYPSIFNTAATTPHDVQTEGELFFPFVQKCALNGDLVALGETGLDYHYAHSDKEIQKSFLMRYFELALTVNLPIVFHVRDAFEDLFDLSKNYYLSSKKGALVHCFTGTLDEARACLDRGWYLSFSGIVTFKKSAALREVLSFVPLDRILIETDTPYLAPQSKRGQVNQPAFMEETAECIAAVKNISVASVAEYTSKNAEQFFCLPK